MYVNSMEQFGMVFSKIINNLQSLTKLLRQNRKFIFQSKKTPLTSPPPTPIQCCSQSFRLLTTNPGQIQHWYWGVRQRIWNLKNCVICWIYWIFNFCVDKFSPGSLCPKNKPKIWKQVAIFWSIKYNINPLMSGD